jgi:hypothetical protein
MFGLIIAFIFAILVLYKLFSVIGYHDDGERLEKKIKEIEILESEIQKTEDEINRNYEIVKNSEEDDKIFRNLNHELQKNLGKIFELDPHFHLSEFVKYCDSLLTKIFEKLKSGNLDKLSDICNTSSMDKLKNLIKNKQFTKTLIKIDKINIEGINISDNKEYKISINIISDQMIPNDKNEFIYSTITSSLLIGKSFQNNENPKWLLIDFNNI